MMKTKFISPKKDRQRIWKLLKIKLKKIRAKEMKIKTQCLIFKKAADTITNIKANS